MGCIVRTFIGLDFVTLVEAGTFFVECFTIYCGTFAYIGVGDLGITGQDLRGQHVVSTSQGLYALNINRDEAICEKLVVMSLIARDFLLMQIDNTVILALRHRFLFAIKQIIETFLADALAGADIVRPFGRILAACRG